MGLFTNPLGYAGYPPGVTASAEVVNSTVRAATTAEVQAGTLNDVYVSPATIGSIDTGLFASPPPLGDVAPNTVASTTLTSSGNTTLATAVTATSATIANAANTGALVVQIANGASGANSEVDILSGVGTTGAGTLKMANNTRVTTIDLGNVAPAAARTTTVLGGNAAVNDTLTIFGGAPSANTQSLTVFGGVATGGTQTVSLFSGNSSAGTQSFNLFTGTHAGTTNIGTGAAVHVLNLLASTGTLGVFGQTAAVQQTQGVLTNSVTSGGSTGTIANFTDLTVYANDAATIRNDIYQLALALSGVITGLRAYGFFK